MTIASRLYAAWTLKRGNFPGRLQIETTNRCNASCTMCPIRHMDRPKGNMDPALFEKIALELAQQPPLRRVVLHVMGEPLVNPDFIDLIKMLRRIAPHQPVEFSTNGSLLDSDKIQGIIETGVDTVNFSIDSCSPETHAKIRQGLNFDRVMSNLKAFVAAMSESGKNKPKVLIQFIKMDVNRDEWETFAQTWRALSEEHDFLEVYIKEQWSWGGYLDSGQAEKEKKDAFLSLPCGYPFDQLDVYWDGRVGFCCLDEDAELAVGDVNHQSLSEIWNSTRLEEIRSKFKAFKFTGLRCDTCGEKLRYRRLADLGGRPRQALARMFGARGSDRN